MVNSRSDIAEAIKERLTARQVVEAYGFHIDYHGYIQCPFHQGDNHGSLKVYEGEKTGWHCFGCGAGGSVIDFVMKLYNINFSQACLRIDMDFNLGLYGRGTNNARPCQSDVLLKRAEEEKARKAAEEEHDALASEHCYWWNVRKLFAPTEEDAAVGYIHPLFAEALKMLPYLEYRLDAVVKKIGR